MINSLLLIAILLFLVKFSQEAIQYNTISDLYSAAIQIVQER